MTTIIEGDGVTIILPDNGRRHAPSDLMATINRAADQFRLPVMPAAISKAMADMNRAVEMVTLPIKGF